MVASAGTGGLVAVGNGGSGGADVTGAGTPHEAGGCSYTGANDDDGDAGLMVGAVGLGIAVAARRRAWLASLAGHAAAT